MGDGNPSVSACGHRVLRNAAAAEPSVCRAGRRQLKIISAEKGTTMFCNSCNNGIWLIILIIILFGWGGNGNGMGCGCGCNNNCCNNGCCDNNCGCNNGCC